MYYFGFKSSSKVSFADVGVGLSETISNFEQETKMSNIQKIFNNTHMQTNTHTKSWILEICQCPISSNRGRGCCKKEDQRIIFIG